MSIRFIVPGSRRKELVATIAAWLGEKSKYLGMPTCAYGIGEVTVEKDGTVLFGTLAEETVERLMEHLYDEGFEAEYENATQAAGTEPETGKSVSVIIPKNGMTEAQDYNLSALIASKANLIKKALGTENLYTVNNEESIEFPWLRYCETEDERNAVTTFINALVEMAKKQTRITAKEKEVDNEKYAFRCFLLRLGFIGNEYKTARKVLLKNFEGSSAFKTVKEADANV